MGIFDLVKPKWQHSDPNVRIREIKNLGESNQPIIDSIAQRDKNADVRRIAIKKVNSLDVLIAISQCDAESDLRQIAKQRFSESINKDLKKESIDVAALELFSKLEDVKYIEDALQNAASDAVRLAAVAKVEKETVLAKVAKEDTVEAVAIAAAEKVARVNLLEEIQKYSRHSKVRSIVSKKISQIESKDKANTHNKFESRKRDVLLKTLSDIAGSANIHDRLAEVESMYAEGKKLITETTQEFTSKLEKSVSGIKQKISDAEATIKAKQEEKQRNAVVAEECKAECEALEELLNLGTDAITSDKLDSQKSAWNSLGEKYSETAVYAEYTTRFNKTLERIDNMVQEVVAEKLGAEKKLERRNDLIAQLGLLKEAVGSKTFHKQIQSIDSRWKALGEAADAEKDLDNQYQSLRKELEAESDKSYEAHREVVKERLSKLEGICADVEALDEDGDFTKIIQTLREKQNVWKEIVGDDKSQFQKIYTRFQQALARFNEMREWELWHNEKEKNKLIEEAQVLGTIEDDRELFKAINSLKQKWRAIGHVPASLVEEIWQRFNGALEPHMERCTEYLKQQEAEFEENFKIKQRIVESIKNAVATVENWKEQSDVVKKLQEEWKNTGFVAKDKVKELQELYRKTCDTFYEKKREFLKSEDDRRLLNLDQKVALCEDAEAIQDSDQWKETTEKLKALQTEWKNIGPVPKEHSDPIWARFRKACDGFFENKRTHYEKIEEGRVGNLEKKVALCERLENENLDPSSEQDRDSFEAIRKEWETIGHVPKDDSDAVFERFIKNCDEYLERQMEVDPEVKAEVETKKVRKRALINKAQELSESSDWKETSEKLKELQTDWRKIGRVGTEDPELWKEFRVHCDEFFTRKRETYEILQQNRINNLEGKLTLCEQAERLAGREYDEEVVREAKLLRDRWKEIGAVPRKDSDKIWKRFNAACDKVFEKRKQARETEEA
ncbi:MAG: DUF349 domain-containing protein [Fibrobacterales bacterium]